MGLVPVHVPLWQLSVCVHALPSLQDVPLVTGVCVQVPELQTSVVQALLSSQFGGEQTGAALLPPVALVPPVALDPPVLAPPVALEPPVLDLPPVALEPPVLDLPPVAFEPPPVLPHDVRERAGHIFLGGSGYRRRSDSQSELCDKTADGTQASH